MEDCLRMGTLPELERQGVARREGMADGSIAVGVLEEAGGLKANCRSRQGMVRPLLNTA